MIKMPGQWHSEWQNEVPDERREVTMGKHRADAVTPSGWVVEFQHSHLKVEEVARRESHYERGIWVVDMEGRQSPPWWCVTAKWKVFLDYGDYIKPYGTNLKLPLYWLVEFMNSGQNEITLNWSRAKALKSPQPCTICGRSASLVDPFDWAPKHKSCAEDALNYSYHIDTLI